jgi:hypothetical protein
MEDDMETTLEQSLTEMEEQQKQLSLRVGKEITNVSDLIPH